MSTHVAGVLLHITVYPLNFPVLWEPLHINFPLMSDSVDSGKLSFTPIDGALLHTVAPVLLPVRHI